MTKVENEDEGDFLLGIKFFKNPDGSFVGKINWLNRSVPSEVILEQIRAFLKHQEEGFYNKWKGNLPDFDGSKSGE